MPADAIVIKPAPDVIIAADSMSLRAFSLAAVYIVLHELADSHLFRHGVLPGVRKLVEQISRRFLPLAGHDLRVLPALAFVVIVIDYQLILILPELSDGHIHTFPGTLKEPCDCTEAPDML